MPGDIWEAITLFELSEKNILPVAGGALDQSSGFADGYQFYLSIFPRLKITRA